MRVTVLGAGAWGTALAMQAAQRHPTVLWARDATQARALDTARENTRYLPGLPLPAALQVTHHFEQATAHAGSTGLTIVATPTAGLRSTLQRLPLDNPTLWLCKGFEAGTGLLGHEIARELGCPRMVGVLSGPSFAQEVARGLPAALVVASTDAELRERAIAAFHGQAMRIYGSDDPVGVEVGGALKNVLAIATGVADGMGLGHNARAALITRGLAEMTRLGVALGARADTFMGLSGLGDLVLTATGDLSRNRRVGLRLAEGLPLATILQELGHVAEGVYTARTALERATRLNVEMPITQAVVGVLEGRTSPREAVLALMAREARHEH